MKLIYISVAKELLCMLNIYAHCSMFTKFWILVWNLWFTFLIWNKIWENVSLRSCSSAFSQHLAFLSEFSTIQRDIFAYVIAYVSIRMLFPSYWMVAVFLVYTCSFRFPKGKPPGGVKLVNTEAIDTPSFWKLFVHQKSFPGECVTIEMRE